MVSHANLLPKTVQKIGEMEMHSTKIKQGKYPVSYKTTWDNRNPRHLPLTCNPTPKGGGEGYTIFFQNRKELYEGPKDESPCGHGCMIITFNIFYGYKTLISNKLVLSYKSHHLHR